MLRGETRKNIELLSMMGFRLKNTLIFAHRKSSGVVQLHIRDKAILVSDLSQHEFLNITRASDQATFLAFQERQTHGAPWR